MKDITLHSQRYFPFNYHYQMYNWFYPLDADFYPKDKSVVKRKSISDASNLVNHSGIKTRALYFHIPFCETLCSFCPFVKGRFQSASEVETYVDALVREVQIRARHKSISSVPINSIFFGGGTPSVLSPEQISRIGTALADYFDLSELEEFSFEVEAKSINDEKAAALRSIGVTHGRFGFQTFDPTYRELFTLTASVDQCLDAASILKRNLPFVSFDILYGMDGQTFDQLAQDLEMATQVGTDNIDVYPVNNIVTQLELHRGYKEKNLSPLSVSTKLAMRRFADDVMRTNGFVAHNGHGYVRSKKSNDWNLVLTDEYRFKYHDACYGYEDSDLIGFGSSAVSVSPGAVITNELSRGRYAKSLLSDSELYANVRIPDEHEYPTRPLNGCLPYHGKIEKSRVRWDAIPQEVITRLYNCIDAGLIVEDDKQLALTRAGWLWYVNLMYFLTPSSERVILDEYVEASLTQNDRRDGKHSI